MAEYMLGGGHTAERAPRLQDGIDAARRCANELRGQCREATDVDLWTAASLDYLRAVAELMPEYLDEGKRKELAKAARAKVAA